MTTDKIAALAPPILSVSDSIILQPAEIDDAERYWNLVADNHDRLSNWIQIEKPASTVENRRKTQAKYIANNAQGDGYWWLIEFNGQLAGTISFHHVERRERWALSAYWLAEGFIGKGIMTQSLKAIIDWGFSELKLNRVEIQASLNNMASTAIPERLGIGRESIRRQSEVINGVALDMASYAAFADNWPPKPPTQALPAIEIRVDDDILLRQHIESDLESMWSAFTAGRDYLGEYLPWIASYKTKGDFTRLYTARRLEKDNFDGSSGYVVEYEGELAGTVGFGVPNRDNVAEVGYWLRKDLQGQGIMTRSVEAIITMLFVEVGIHRVTIRAATSNLPSRGIPERLGFKHEGTMRDGGFVNDEYLDLEIYSMLDHEWLARSKHA
jgi:ribosomal-protein-serine acetyltransferase